MVCILHSATCECLTGDKLSDIQDTITDYSPGWPRYILLSKSVRPASNLSSSPKQGVLRISQFRTSNIFARRRYLRALSGSTSQTLKNSTWAAFILGYFE